MGGLEGHRLTLLSHSAEVLKVGVFEVCRIFQPVAEEAVCGDVAGPNDGDGLEERAMGLKGNEKEKYRQERVWARL